MRQALALEMFGRDGTWHTREYVREVGSLEIWEIDPTYEAKLKADFPEAKIKIVDSFVEARATSSRYDLIVIDNPQSIYNDGKYCEHFELFPDVLHLAGKDGAILIMNVNLKPYGFDKNGAWAARRARFYETSKPEELAPDHAVATYSGFARKAGMAVDWSFFVPRNSFISYLAIRLAR